MPSGVADYTSEIVPYVAERAEVDVFCPKPGLLKRPKRPDGARQVLEPAEFFQDPGAYDACFYHLGNNPYHEFIYYAARRRPEIAVFHDAVLHHLIAHVTIEWGGDAGGYEGILHGEYGDLGSKLALLKRGWLATDFEKFLFPLTGHVAKQAKGIVVHSRDAAERMREHAPDVPLVVIPHHAGKPPPEVEGMTREEARERLGLPLHAFVVAHLGFITRPKQPAAVVGGFAQLHREVLNSVLLLVGADNTGGALGRLVGQLGIGSAVRMAGYVDLVRLYVHLKASDAVINLRYPSAGESSGTLARSLAEGRAVIVNNYGSWAELPGDTVLKVEIDGPQADQVGAHLLRLAGDPAFRAGIEHRSRRYAAEVLDLNRCRDQYLEFARTVSGRTELLLPAPPAEPQPPRSHRRHPTFMEIRAMREELHPKIDEITGHSLTRTGLGVFVDMLYRMALRRPAEEDAIRNAHVGLTVEGKLTRSQLTERILTSREFKEILIIEDLVQDALRSRSVSDPGPGPGQAPGSGSGGPFTVREGSPLPPDTTERVVEIPWVLSRVGDERRVLDVGYAFASGEYLSALLDLEIPELHGVDLATAFVPDMHRARADIRRLPYRDGAFDLVLCISTLEHIGHDNTQYGLPFERRHHGQDAVALAELARVLSPSGHLLISVPFGRREERGWFKQYDFDSWNELLERAGLAAAEQEHFKLTEKGWQPVPDPRTMGLLSYGDGVPAAKGVLCAALVHARPR
jgi:SAM-dependent methyltransferase/glycosyltransferase involved in cell wall biosynthesis